MWIDAQQVSRILSVGSTKAYEIIRKLKSEQEQLGYYTNPNAKVPTVFFYERFGLDQNEVKEILNKT